jgi:hypothetical protein
MRMWIIWIRSSDTTNGIRPGVLNLHPNAQLFFTLILGSGVQDLSCARVPEYKIYLVPRSYKINLVFLSNRDTKIG